MVKRWAESRLNELLKLRRGVNLTGARQVGKSTLASLIQPHRVRRYTLDDWDEEAVYLDENRNGKFIETWVYQQLAAMADVSGEYEISHYRDGRKREIDFLKISHENHLPELSFTRGRTCCLLVTDSIPSRSLLLLNRR